jgi:hypothetical protein
VVFVNPAVRMARHRRIAVALRRHLDQLLLPLGYSYQETQVEKHRVVMTYAKGEEKLTLIETDHHEVGGAHYRLQCGDREVSFTLESELGGAAAQLIGEIG